MQTNCEAEQLSIYDLDSWRGRTFPEPSPVAHQREKTSGVSSRRSSELKSVVFQSLDLKRKDLGSMQVQQKYFIPIEGKLIEVEKNVYVAYYKMDRRERYLEERDKDNGVVSYNTIDSQGIDGESGLQDVVTETMETIALANELRNQLHRCIAALPKAERELIHAIYFEGMTEAEYASKSNMTQSGISRRRKKTLSKLKKLLNIMGSIG